MINRLKYFEFGFDFFDPSVSNWAALPCVQAIEEGLKQKTRQNVVVLDWGSRSNAALGNFGVKV